MFLRDSIVGVGVMSGTSVDGIDVAVVRFPSGNVGSCKVLRFAELPFPPALAARVKEAMERGSSEQLCVLDAELGRLFGDAVASVLAEQNESPLFVASHGQTLWHAPAARATLQLGDASSILQRAPSSVQFVVSNFRPADVAAGGQGAPLVPFFDSWAWGSSPDELCLANVGGIANVTLLGANLPVIGFDCGPGNVVADSLCLQLLQLPCDVDGSVSSKGKVVPQVLAEMFRLAKPFLSQESGPRSTGRELFGAQFARQIVSAFPSERPEDLVCTAVEFTAVTMWNAIRRSQRRPATLVVAGGGSRNPTLMSRLRGLGNGCEVVQQDEWKQAAVEGLTAANKEAVAFCLLGLATLLGVPSNVPSVTGASRSVVLGQVAVREGRNLLRSMHDVHRTAGEGFELQTEAYQRGRPEYPLETVARQTALLNTGGGDVVDLGAGTGKLSGALVVCGVHPICVEPAAAMRSMLSTRFPGLKVLSGTSTSIPMSDGSCKAVFAGQAFHWFDNVESLVEIHRVLKPGGRLILIWNMEDDSIDWIAGLKALYGRFEDGTFPQFATMKWRKVWETEAAKELFQVLPEVWDAHVPQVTRQQCWDRVVSKSFISILDKTKQEELKLQCEKVLDSPFANAVDGKIPYPQKTLTFTAIKK